MIKKLYWPKLMLIMGHLLMVTGCGSGSGVSVHKDETVHRASNSATSNPGSFESKDNALKIASPRIDTSKWKAIKMDNYSFQIPPSMKRKDVQGIDTFVWLYQSDSISLSIERGILVSERPSDLDYYDYKEEWTEFGAKRAKVSSYSVDIADNKKANEPQHVIAVYFPEVDKGEEKLSFEFQYRRESDRELAYAILNSIKFNL